MNDVCHLIDQNKGRFYFNRLKLGNSNSFAIFNSNLMASVIPASVKIELRTVSQVNLIWLLI